LASIDELLLKAVASGASDVHIATGSAPLIRRFGQLMRSKSAVLSGEQAQSLLYELLSDAQKKELEESWELDFAYELAGKARFRCNAFRQHKGIDICFRIIKPGVPTLEELGIPDSLKRMMDQHQGLILVTGSAGSGKSSTLAALVNLVNCNRPQHVLTVEDPIEFVHPIKKAAVNQRQLASHTRSYANALKAALREDPDVIIVGEMRDLETTTLAISASETGHLVVGSMNTSSAAKTIDKVIDSYPAGQQNQIRAMLGESLKAVFSQRLLPRADGKGMALAYELLLGSRQLGSLIRDGKTFQINNLMQTGRARGMRLMDDSIQELLKAGTITAEVAQKNLTNTKGALGAAAPTPSGEFSLGTAPPGAAPAAAGPNPAKPGLLGRKPLNVSGGDR
jgi:twitching motility protein PilT